MPSSPEPFPSKVVWTPDGKHIIFSRGYQGIFVVDVAGSELRSIPEDAPLGTPSSPGYVLPVLSPDGTRLAFVARPDAQSQSAAIMVSAIDGTRARRLTQDASFNTHPAWSPDGAEIAYITDGRLAVIRADGTNARVLVPSVEVVHAAPAWSPDGGRIAFVGEPQDAEHRIVYAVRTDGTELTKLGETVSVPSWSPDGRHIAFLIPEDEGEVGLYALTSNEAELLRVWSLEEPVAWVDNLTWSPDGYEILFASTNGEAVAVELGVNKDTVPSRFSEEARQSTYRRLSAPHSHSPPVESEIPKEDGGEVIARGEGRWAAWSPDAERFAVVLDHDLNGTDGTGRQDVLYTLFRFEMMKRVLVQSHEQRLVARFAGWYDGARNVAACAEAYVVSDPAAEGFVVPAPFTNPGLVEDCQTLMTIRDTLAGDFLLNWGRETPITEWWGVIVSTTRPSRVETLFLLGKGLEFDLAYVFYLLSFFGAGRTENSPWYPWGSHGYSIGYPGLTGKIPAELTKLTKLSALKLGYNRLTGTIPLELGNMTSLSVLELRNNGLTGAIPPELGNITNLSVLDLSHNDLTGAIPPELGNLRHLRELLLHNNRLSGELPPELGNILFLEKLYLFGNSLSGCVPAAVSSPLTKIRTDDLEPCE